MKHWHTMVTHAVLPGLTLTFNFGIKLQQQKACAVCIVWKHSLG